MLDTTASTVVPGDSTRDFDITILMPAAKSGRSFSLFHSTLSLLPDLGREAESFKLSRAVMPTATGLVLVGAPFTAVLVSINRACRHSTGRWKPRALRFAADLQSAIDAPTTIIWSECLIPLIAVAAAGAESASIEPSLLVALHALISLSSEAAESSNGCSLTDIGRSGAASAAALDEFTKELEEEARSSPGANMGDSNSTLLLSDSV